MFLNPENRNDGTKTGKRVQNPDVPGPKNLGGERKGVSHKKFHAAPS